MASVDEIISSVDYAFEMYISEFDGCSDFDREKVEKEREEAIELLKSKKITRCKDCIHRPTKPDDYDPSVSDEGFRLEFPDNMCPANCDDGYYSWYPSDNFFCGYGKRSDGDG